MIPRRFFWLFDAIVLLGMFGVAYLLSPAISHLFRTGGPLRAAWLVALLRPVASGESPRPLQELWWILLVVAPTALLVLGLAGNYRPLLSQSRTLIVLGSFAAPLAGLALVALILFAVKRPQWSRMFIFLFGFLTALGLCLYRLALHRYFTMRHKGGYWARNVLLIGLPAGIERLARHISKVVSESDYRVLGYLTAGADGAAQSEAQALSIEGLQRLGSAAELGELLIHRPVHEVIALQPGSASEWMQQVIRDCDYFGILLRIVPEALLFSELEHLKALHRSEPLRLPAVVLTSPYYDTDALFVKRLIDIVVSAGLLIFMAPLFLLIAIAIKITTPDLPVFYRWRVVGQNGVEFTGYKFTTMAADADERKQDLADRNEMTGPVFKIKDDPRVTPLGRFLRKYSLNELPQFWSVVKGDMSLVGPRPAGPHELERYEFWHKRKLSFRSGITCLWQVRGRNKISDFDEWVRLDLEYIDRWSLWLDFKIFMRTIWVVLAGSGS